MVKVAEVGFYKQHSDNYAAAEAVRRSKALFTTGFANNPGGVKKNVALTIIGHLTKMDKAG